MKAFLLAGLYHHYVQHYGEILYGDADSGHFQERLMENDDMASKDSASCSATVLSLTASPFR